MLNASRLVCFVATADADRARAFYRDALGLALIEDGGYALVFEANGTQLRVQRVEAVAPHPYTALGWEVDDVTAAVRALAARGVAMARFPGLPLDADGIWDTPDGSRVAWLHDPDGNTLSISQPPKA
jgi:catechol 2,3-dioxygenase-like lactoylglutathione lyase family enzyme